MAATVKMIGGRSSSATASFGRRLDSRKRTGRISMAMASSPSRVSDPYEILQIQRGAPESDVKKAFRRLALKHHPDVCKGDNCGIQFHQINEAYNVLMDRSRDQLMVENSYGSGTEDDEDETYVGMDEDWDLWDEWMGWEGAGIRDYSSHINPYI